jgi:hypothetical protein
MKKCFVLVLLGLCVCLISGCCNTAVSPEPPAASGPYLTWDNGPIEIYVTSQPIDGVHDYVWIEPGTGEYSSSGYYYSEMGIIIPHATKWSDGSITLSVAQYEGANYGYSVLTSEFNDTSFVSNGREGGEAEGTEPDVWYVGDAPAGRTKSDYTYDSNRDIYVYNGSQNSEPINQTTDALTSDPDDDNDDDVNGIIENNDGLNLSR